MSAPSPRRAPLFAPGERPGLLRKRILPPVDAPIKTPTLDRFMQDAKRKADEIEACQSKPVAAPKEFHQQIVRLPVSALLDVLCGRIKVLNIPEGAALLSSWYDSVYDGTVETDRLLCLRIEHPSLDAVQEGRAIPKVVAILGNYIHRYRGIDNEQRK